MNEEKKLTDEEIIKALNNEKKHLLEEQELTGNTPDTQIVYVTGEAVFETLDLIHRLQEEIEQLTRESDEMFDRHAKENQAASILIEKRNNEIAELQKQVDELKERCEIAEGTKRRLTIFDRIEIHDKAVETTVKEILILAEDYNCGEKDDIDNFMLALKERYGVEVE